MTKISKEILKKYHLKPNQYRKDHSVLIVSGQNGKYVIKDKKSNHDIYRYLKARNFDYYPPVINSEEDECEITEYVEEVNMPEEQKLMDMISLLSLLHNKTTYYKEVSVDEFKKIYEDLDNNIRYLFSYYQDTISIIESKKYMSPSEYFLARNISEIFSAITYSKQQLDKWYQLVESKRRIRYVVLHNNLELDHFIENEQPYFISWNKAKIDSPVFDLYKLYRKIGDRFDFSILLDEYEKKYPLLEEEKNLLIVLLTMPLKIEMNQDIFDECKMITKELEALERVRHMLQEKKPPQTT